MAALNFCQMQARVGDRELVETAPTDPSPAPGTSCSLRYEPGRTVAHFQVSRTALSEAARKGDRRSAAQMVA